MATLHASIVRSTFDGGIAGRVVHYEVPYFERMSVIDVLRYVRESIDPTLAFRYSCEEGKCGLCGMEVNGRSVLACKRVVGAGENLEIAPLPGFPVLRDLIVDRVGYNSEIAEHRNAVGEAGCRPPASDEDYLAASDCVECGVCAATCPSGQAGIHAQAGPVGFLESARAALLEPDRMVSAEGGADLFKCLECGQCTEVCGRNVPVARLVSRARNAARPVGVWPRGAQAVVARLEEGKPLLARAGVAGTSAWLEQADPRVRGRIGKPGAEYGVFIGCQYGLRSSLSNVADHLMRLLLEADVDFTILGPDERCCGHPCEAVGSEAGVAASARYHVDAFKTLGVRAVVVGCPGCYRAWSDEYPAALGHPTGIEAIHTSVFLHDLLEHGRWNPSHPYGRSIAYHDPCELGRLSGIYAAPRLLLDALPGVRRGALRLEREMARCCGGGGLAPSAGANPTTHVRALRIADLLESGMEDLVTACPNCEATLASELRAQGANAPRVLDIIDVLYASVFGEDG